MSSEPQNDVDTPKRFPTRALAAGVIGNFIESYEFILYATFAPIIGATFFPAYDRLSSTLAAFSVFAVGFLVRPIGAVVFGHIGDRMGRRQALSLAIIITSGATVLIGLLPGSEQIGIVAPIILVLLRSLQGFGFAGEFVGALAYVVEYSPKRRAGLAGGVVLSFTILAGLFAVGVALGLQALLGEETMQSWGWRLPFLIAAPLGLIGLYLRNRLDDTPEFRSAVADNVLVERPIVDVLQNRRFPLFLVVSQTTVQTVAFYYLVAFFLSHMTEVLHVDRAVALATNMIGLVAYAFGSPFWGWLSDSIGRKPVAITGLATIALGALPAFQLLGQADWLSLAAAQALIGTGLAALASANALILLELFPTNVRYSGGSVGYNIAQMIFGGTAPAVATGLFVFTGSALAPAMYLAVLAGVALLIAIFLLPETRSTEKAASL